MTRLDASRSLSIGSRVQNLTFAKFDQPPGHSDGTLLVITESPIMHRAFRFSIVDYSVDEAPAAWL